MQYYAYYYDSVQHFLFQRASRSAQLLDVKHIPLTLASYSLKLSSDGCNFKQLKLLVAAA